MSTPLASNSDLILAKENIHHLTYFPFHGLAGCIRTTLVLLGEPYENHTLSFGVRDQREKRDHQIFLLEWT
jgi:hypothetical protein